jgi:hypothetical protein
MGNALTSPPVAVIAGNHIEVFVIDTTSGFLLHQEGTLSGTYVPPTWSGWENLWNLEVVNGAATPTGKLASMGRAPAVVVTQPNNQVNVFATFADGSVKAVKVNGYRNFGFWTNLGGVSLYEPGAASWGSNRLDVFTVGTDAALYHQYSNDEGTTFYPGNGNWERVGGNAASGPSVVSWGPNRLDVFVSGRPPEQITGVQHLAWTGTSWGTCAAPPCWDSMHMLAWQDGTGGPMSPPVAVTTGVGAINVFVQTIDEGLEMFAMTASNPPAWGDAQEVAGCFRTGGMPAVISPDGNTLDVAVTGYAANGDASVYANSTAGGTEFFANGVTPPPACSCGFPGGPCCWPDNGCNAYASCGASIVCACDAGYVQQTVNGQPQCVPTGGVGEPCNANGTCNAGQIVCKAGTCVATGGTGEPCNANGTCNSGNVCSNGVCDACGGNGEVCCSGSACGGSGLSCQSGKCAPCGAAGEACCAGSTCSSASDSCQSGKCAACGAAGEACCAGSTCSSASDSCQSGKCAACGAAGEACCAGSKCSSASDSCQSGKCEACGGSGAACCAGNKCSVSGQSCQGGKCEPTPTCGGSGQACCADGCNSISLSCENNVCCAVSTFDVCVSCDGTSTEDVSQVACNMNDAIQLVDASLTDGCAAFAGPCPQ